MLQASKDHAHVAAHVPSRLLQDLDKLLELHERSVKDEYVQEVTKQGLLLERSVVGGFSRR